MKDTTKNYTPDLHEWMDRPLHLIMYGEGDNAIITDNGSMDYCQGQLKRLKKKQGGEKYYIKRFPNPMGLKPQNNEGYEPKYKSIFEDGAFEEQKGKYPKHLKKLAEKHKKERAKKIKAFQEDARKRGVKIEIREKRTPEQKRKYKRTNDPYYRPPANRRVPSLVYYFNKIRIQICVVGKNIKLPTFAIEDQAEASEFMKHKFELRNKIYTELDIPLTQKGCPVVVDYFLNEDPKLWDELVKMYPKT